MANDRKLADDFCKKYDVVIKYEYMGKDKLFLTFPNEVNRKIYKVTVKRGKKQFTTMYGASLACTKNNMEPENYDILSVLIKYNPGSYKKWLKDYQFEDNKDSQKRYKMALKEFENVERVFGDDKKCFNDLKKIF